MADEWCEACGAIVAGARTRTGHIVAATYRSGEHAMRYVVDGAATKWECAPGAATRLVWENGNVTVTDAPVATGDRLICRSCTTGALVA